MKDTLLVMRFFKSKKKVNFGCASLTVVAILVMASFTYPLTTSMRRDTRREIDPNLLNSNNAKILQIINNQYDVLNPPGLNLAEFKSSNTSNTQQLQMMSETVQSQIRSLQNSTNCGNNAIICGHADTYCGFGCHIHHRAACLMISYWMGLPLIHETEIDGGKWTFSTPWSKVMRPLGSACNVTNSTYKWTWRHSTGFYSRPQSAMEFAWNHNQSMQPGKLGFPLFDGIVAASPVAEMVEKLHPSPFLWWASQFVQYAMQIQPKTMKRIRKDQALIGLRDDCIGLHVRRTDKINEAKDSFHDLDEYFSKVNEVTDKVFRENGRKSKVFIASDDSSILSISKEKYKKWDVVGFTSNRTLNSPSERKDYLYEVLRDTLSLARCSTVICGLSSNICRLLMEIQTGSQRRLISFERAYFYRVLGATLKPHINKISSRAIHQVNGQEVV